MTSRLTPAEIETYTTSATSAAMEFHESWGKSLNGTCCEDKIYCEVCSANFCFRMGPGCPDVDSVLGDLEMVDRVAMGLKPLATVVLSGKSDKDTEELEVGAVQHLYILLTRTLFRRSSTRLVWPSGLS